jgi:hypothetical protein
MLIIEKMAPFDTQRSKTDLKNNILEFRKTYAILMYFGIYGKSYVRNERISQLK